MRVLVAGATSVPGLPLLRELGIGFVPYSPLGRGFLTGTIKQTDHLADNDFRRNNPRFQGAALTANVGLVETLEGLARDKGCSAGQLALAWLLHQAPDIAPIPGTTKVARLEENAAAVDIALTDEDLTRIDAAAPVGAAAGSRYPDMSSVHR